MCYNRFFHKNQSLKTCKVKEYLEEIGYFQEIETPHTYLCGCGHRFKFDHTYSLCPNCQTKYVIHPSKAHQPEHILKVGIQ
ncbi:MAG TPA: hypothetical protein DCY20_06905 [Firmicutes bacterium]|nr:hypothetical protein [Bacillota bacterium]